MAHYSVFTGQWTDWSQGAVLGTKLTLDASSSNVLIASIATLNALVSAVAWTILSSILFRARARRNRPNNGLFYQTQALLRNSQSPVSFAYDILRTTWSWRNLCSRSTIISSISLAAPALIIFLVFNLAALLLSQISTNGEVLLRSNICGQINLTDILTLPPEKQQKYELAAASNLQQSYVASSAYAQFCYKDANVGIPGPTASQSPASNCEYYVSQALNWTTTRPNHCPFNGLCAVPDSEVIMLDTGRLDSNDHFGINAEPKNRVQFRRVTTCSPINTEKYSSNGFINVNEPDRVALYYFGFNSLQRPTSGIDGHYLIDNATFVYDKTSYMASNIPYELIPASEYLLGDDGGPTYNATSAIYNGPGIVSLLFLANRAYYVGEGTSDPWFNATKSDPNFVVQGIPNFFSENPGSILGCVEETKICNPINGDCMDAPHYELESQLQTFSKIQLNDMQAATANIIYNVLSSANLGTLTLELGSRFLAANNYLVSSGIISFPLPVDQWQNEVENAQAITMAFLQRHVFDSIGGPADPAIADFITPYRDGNERNLCYNLKFKNSAYSSFSVLALGLIFGIDGLIILAYIYVKILPRIQHRRGKINHQSESWAANSVLQLQRGVYEQLGFGTWHGDIYNVPITDKLENFHSFTGLDVLRSASSNSSSDSTQFGGSNEYKGKLEGDIEGQSPTTTFTNNSVDLLDDPA